MLVTATDIAIVAPLLEQPADSATDLARVILKALYANDHPASIAARRGAVAVVVAGRFIRGVGPYPTVNAAVKAAEDGSIPTLGIERLVPIVLNHPLKGRVK